MAVSPLWMQSAILTLIFGFAILGYAAVRTYRESAPVPAKIVDEKGAILFDREEIVQGQEHFLTYGLMQYGTVYGHGAQAAPDRRPRGEAEGRRFHRLDGLDGRRASARQDLFLIPNNWLPDELLGNTLTGEAIMWSTMSLVALMGGIGIALGVFGRFGGTIGWHETK
jgi:nitric oxide reductase large subunit